MMVIARHMANSMAPFGGAVDNRNQAKLQRIQRRVDAWVDDIRTTLGRAPDWEPARDAKTGLIKAANRYQRLVEDVVETDSWLDAQDLALEGFDDMQDLIADAYAELDAIGFERGAYC